MWKVLSAAWANPYRPWRRTSARTFGQDPLRSIRASPTILIDDFSGKGQYSLLVHVEPPGTIDPDVQTILPGGIPSKTLEEAGLRDSGDGIERASANATGWECHGDGCCGCGEFIVVRVPSSPHPSVVPHAVGGGVLSPPFHPAEERLRKAADSRGPGRHYPPRHRS